MGNWKDDLRQVKEQLDKDRIVGVIRTLRGGYGFIRIYPEGEPRQDVFFHRSELQGIMFNSLEEGDVVSFTLSEDGDRGEKAERVELEKENHLRKGAVK